MSPRTIFVSTSLQGRRYRIQGMIMTISILSHGLPRFVIDSKCMVVEVYK